MQTQSPDLLTGLGQLARAVKERNRLRQALVDADNDVANLRYILRPFVAAHGEPIELEDMTFWADARDLYHAHVIRTAPPRIAAANPEHADFGVDFRRDDCGGDLRAIYEPAPKPHVCKCECEVHVEPVQQVEVSSGFRNWGTYWYCQTAIAEDRNRGLVVEVVEPAEERQGVAS